MTFLAKLIAYKVARFGRDTTATLSATVDLSKPGGVYIGPKDVRSAVTFVPANAVAWGGCQMTLIADGTHVPDFSAFTALAGSSSWSNTAGHTHLATFMYDGSRYWYSLATGASAAMGLTLHTLAVDGTSLTASANIALNTSYTPAGSAFTVVGSSTGAQTVSSVTVAAGGITLALSPGVAGGETVTLTVDRDAANYLRANADNSKLAVPVQVASVTNNTDYTGGIKPFAYTQQSASFRDPTETGVEDKCDGTTSGSAETGLMVKSVGGTPTVVSATLSAPCWVAFRHRDADIGGGVAMHSSSTSASPPTTTVAQFNCAISSATKYLIWRSAAYSGGADQNTGYRVPDGAWVKLGFEEGSTPGTYDRPYIEISVDNGATWARDSTLWSGTYVPGGKFTRSLTSYPWVFTIGATGRATYRPRYYGFS